MVIRKDMLYLVGAAAVIAGLSFAFTALADSYSDPDGVPRLVPFRAHLELGGEPVNTEVTLDVSLYDAASGGTRTWGPEAHTVTPVAGELTLMLGQTSALPPSVLAGGDAWIEIAIDGTPLAGRQRLASAPYALVAANGVPPGTVISYAGGALPAGWLPCDGRALTSTDPRYAPLFAAIATTYGDGSTGDGADGTTDFNVPDLRGRVAVGAGAYTDATLGEVTRLPGDALGSAAHTLSVAEMPAHTHGYGDYYYYDQSTGSPSFQTPEGDDTGTRAEASRTTGTTGGGMPHNNMQPSLVLSYIIKL